MRWTTLFLTALGVLGLVSVAEPLKASTIIDFGCVAETAGSTCGNIASDLTVSASSTTLSGGQAGVSFQFQNNVPANNTAGIANIYFDTPLTLFTGIASIVNGPGVDFVLNGTPSDLPGGTNVGFTSTFSASAASPSGSTNAVFSGETVTINLALASGSTFRDFVTAFNSGSFQIGEHVQGVGTTGNAPSYSYVSQPPGITATPEPSSYLLLGGGLLALSAIRLRRRERHC